MITSQKNIYFEQDDHYIEARGLSTDTKPTTGIANGSIFIEMDTGKVYYFDAENGEWLVFSGSGGGGGGGGDSDFSTAEITIVNNTGSNPPAAIPVVLDDGDRGSLMGTPGAVQSGTITAALYKGMLMFLNPFEGAEPAPVINTTGDAVFDDGLFIVTGDCTITFGQ